MVALILFVIVGLLFALFATNNTGVVTITLGQFISYSTPLYVAILTSFVIGLALASLFYVFKSVTTGFMLRKHKIERKEAKDEIVELTKRIHKLELENERLKTENGIENEDTNSL